MNLKTDEMFDILNFLEQNNDQYLTGFPPCLHDLKMTLSNIQKFESMNMMLSKKIKDQIEKRLLQPGINTKKIINFYIQLIRVFKFIDPSTVLL